MVLEDFSPAVAVRVYHGICSASISRTWSTNCQSKKCQKVSHYRIQTLCVTILSQTSPNSKKIFSPKPLHRWPIYCDDVLFWHQIRSMFSGLIAISRSSQNFHIILHFKITLFNTLKKTFKNIRHQSLPTSSSILEKKLDRHRTSMTSTHHKLCCALKNPVILIAQTRKLNEMIKTTVCKCICRGESISWQRTLFDLHFRVKTWSTYKSKEISPSQLFDNKTILILFGWIIWRFYLKND